MYFPLCGLFVLFYDNFGSCRNFPNTTSIFLILVMSWFASVGRTVATCGKIWKLTKTCSIKLEKASVGHGDDRDRSHPEWWLCSLPGVVTFLNYQAHLNGRYPLLSSLIHRFPPEVLHANQRKLSWLAKESHSTDTGGASVQCRGQITFPVFIMFSSNCLEDRWIRLPSVNRIKITWSIQKVILDGV